MYKHTIKLTDYFGNEREIDYHFNLSKAELLRMEMSKYGGMEQLLTRIVKEQDTKKIYEMFEDIVKSAYGVIGDDGIQFVKNEEILNKFVQSEAYSELIMKMIEDADFASEFIRGCFPKDVREKVAQQENGNVASLPKRENNPVPAPSDR